MDKEQRTQEEQGRKVLSRLGGKVNVVDYKNNENENELVNLDLNIRTDNIDQEFVKAVYSGRDINMNAYKGIVDTGAPKTVAGPVYTSNLGYIIPVTIGNLGTELKVLVVEANVPLLLGLDFQQEFGVVIDTGRQTLYIKASGEEFDMGQSKAIIGDFP